MGMIGGPGQRKYHSAGGRDLEWWERVGFIERPDALVKKAAGLLESERWEEVVVGLSVLTGRCLAEVLKTGVMYPKTRYMVWYTTYQEQVDLVWGPFEVPTLVEAERVLVAWSRVRMLFTEGEGVLGEERAQDICEQYRWRVSACAKEHFERRVPVDEHRDWYAPLYLCIYPLIATWYYCPTWKQPRWYAEKIRGYDWLAQRRDEGARKPHCAGCIRECSTYAVGNGVNNHAGGQGLKIGQEGVELLEGIGKQEDVEVRAGGLERECEEGEVSQEKGAGMEEGANLRDMACAVGSLRAMDEQDGASMDESDESDEYVDEWDALEEREARVFVEEERKKIQQERGDNQREKEEGEGGLLFFVSGSVHTRMETVKRRERTRTADGTIAVLVEGYEWLNKGGRLPRGLCGLGAERIPPPEEDASCAYFVSQTIAGRMQEIDQRGGILDAIEVLTRLLDTYEWLIEGGLVEKMGASRR